MAVTGVRETLAAFDRFARDSTRLAIVATADAVQRVRAAAYAGCPVGEEPGPFPGHVRDQIRSQMVPNEPLGAVFVESRGIGGAFGTDNVGLWLEYGTVAHQVRGHSHPGTLAHPFLRPAVEAERGPYLRALDAALDRANALAGLR